MEMEHSINDYMEMMHGEPLNEGTDAAGRYKADKLTTTKYKAQNPFVRFANGEGGYRKIGAGFKKNPGCYVVFSSGKGGYNHNYGNGRNTKMDVARVFIPYVPHPTEGDPEFRLPTNKERKEYLKKLYETIVDALGWDLYKWCISHNCNRIESDWTIFRFAYTSGVEKILKSMGDKVEWNNSTESSPYFGRFEEEE